MVLSQGRARSDTKKGSGVIPKWRSTGMDQVRLPSTNHVSD